jgi:PAS domain S-box-containing protein
MAITRRSDGRILEVNDSYERLFGYARAECLGRTPVELNMYADPADRPRILGRLDEQGNLRDYELDTRTRSGEVRRISLSAEPIRAGDEDCLLTILRDVTERRAMEARLAYHARLLDSVHDAIIATDTELRVTAWNRAAAELYGWPAGEAIGRPVAEVTGSLWSEAERREALRVVREQGVYQEEVEQRTRDGGTVYVEGKTVAVRDPGGVVIGYVTANRDVTDRVEAERELRESEARFRSLFNGMVEGFVLAELIYDQAGRAVDYRYLEANPAFERITGIAFETVVGKTGRELSPDFDPKWVERFERVARTGEPAAYREYGERLDKYIDLRLFRPGENQCAVVFIDVTDRVRYEQALSAGESRYRTLVESLNEGVCQINAEAIIQFVNDQLARMLGYTAEEMLGRSLADFMDDENFARSIRVREERREGRAGQNEYELIRKDGERVPVLISSAPLYDSEGNFAGVVAGVVDITDRKRGEGALAEANAMLRRQKDTLRRLNANLADMVRERTRELEESNKSLAELQRRLMDSVEMERVRVAQELHDGPMQELYTVMYSLPSLGNSLSGEQREAELASIQARLQGINESLRTIARDLRPSVLAPFGLEKAIREHAERYRQDYPDLELALDLASDGTRLPERVRLALYRIYQVALSNALRHAGASRVDVRFRFDDEQVVLEVQDDGCGFVVPRRWLQFAREGHLGLVGAMERAEAVGGHLEVHSAPGQGTHIRCAAPRSGA